MKCADVNERYGTLSVHEKILRGDKEKAKYCYLAILLLFHFSAIIFHVDSCESYATLDTDERQKSGDDILFYCATPYPFHINLIITTFWHILLYKLFKNLDMYKCLCYNIGATQSNTILCFGETTLVKGVSSFYSYPKQD